MIQKLAALFVATWGALILLEPWRVASLYGLGLVVLGFLILDRPLVARVAGPALVVAIGAIVLQRPSRFIFFLWAAFLLVTLALELSHWSRRRV